MVDFKGPVCKLYLLIISADAAQEKEKKRRKCSCLLVFQSLQPVQYIPGTKVNCRSGILPSLICLFVKAHFFTIQNKTKNTQVHFCIQSSGHSVSI
jgi:hypothetical protein